MNELHGCRCWLSPQFVPLFRSHEARRWKAGLLHFSCCTLVGVPSYDLTSGYIEDPQTDERLGGYLYAILPGVMLQGVTEKDGEVYGSSWSGKAMIDTGANTSAAYSPLVKELHFLPRGSQIDVTGSQSQGDATVLGRRSDLRMVDRGDFDPVAAELFKVIIGTDILQVCRFTYRPPQASSPWNINQRRIRESCNMAGMESTLS